MRRNFIRSWCFISALLCAAPQMTLADDENAPSSDAGQIHGQVSWVDYRRGELKLRGDDGREYRVRVSPSTTFGEGGDSSDYHALTDVQVGSHIRADLSRHGHIYEAQTIEIDR